MNAFPAVYNVLADLSSPAYLPAEDAQHYRLPSVPTKTFPEPGAQQDDLYEWEVGPRWWPAADEFLGAR